MLIKIGVAVIAIIMIPLFLSALYKLNERRQYLLAMNGHYGEEVKWATELKESGDREFAEALHVLPRWELREVGVIAESKEELRELTIERYNDD